MSEKLLLDCTLRDGGYINDWEFGYEKIIATYEYLVAAGVDLIEVGFIDERRPYDSNRTIFPNGKSIDNTFRLVKKGSSQALGMIDFGTCSADNLTPCFDSFLDGIRIIFKKHNMYDAMAFCRTVKSLGYKVFAQLVSVTSYSDQELKDLAMLANDVQPYAVSIVDTYGLLFPADLNHYIHILDTYLSSDIYLGLHTHNNLQLAYANAIFFLEMVERRNVLVDGTLSGMGKGAGNAPTELLGKYLNQNNRKQYNLPLLVEAVNNIITPDYSGKYGYSSKYFVCSDNRVHPNYYDFFKNKGNLSTKNIKYLISQIEPQERKLLYDEGFAENLYAKYERKCLDNQEVYKQLNHNLSGGELLLIGPGQSLLAQRNLVIEYIKLHNPHIISVNFIPNTIDVDYVFVSKSNRLIDMSSALLKHSKIKLIVMSDLESVAINHAYSLNRVPLLEPSEKISDNSFIMLLEVLLQSQIRNITCAGFDGYSDKSGNYAAPEMEYDYIRYYADYLNKHVRDVLHTRYSNMNISFLTYSHYEYSPNIESDTF